VTFLIEFAGDDLAGDVDVPVTGGWQTWTTVSTEATLPAGTLLMTFVPTVEGFNVNYFDFLTPTGAHGQLVASPVLHPPHPNPFNPVTTISYEMPKPGTVDLSVYDVAGKLVKRLVAGEIAGTGRHSVTWDGTSDAGRSVATGVYLCRLEAVGQTANQMMVLVK